MGRKEVTMSVFVGFIEMYPGDLLIKNGCVFEGDNIVAKVEKNRYYIYL